ncbi:MAG: EI24 domain-containing protein [Kofleriaceae bacterium]
MFDELARGAGETLRGAGYLMRNPRLWPWVIAPAVVAGIILVIALGWILSMLSAPIAAVAAFLPGEWLDRVFEIIAKIAVAVLGLSVFVSVASLIAGPFNEMLSEQIEARLTGEPSPGFNPLRFVVDVIVGIWHALRRVARYLLVMGLLLLVSAIIPVVGSILATVGSAYLTAQFAAYDAHDAVFARKRWRYRDKVEYLTKRRWRSLGFGGPIALLLLVPGANVVALAIGATAATLTVVDGDRAARGASRHTPR